MSQDNEPGIIRIGNCLFIKQEFFPAVLRGSLLMEGGRELQLLILSKKALKRCLWLGSL